MIFLYYASDSFASRAKVLTDSIKKYHPNDTIVHVKPESGPLGTYLPGMAKARLETALRLLESGNESVIIIGADCELFAPIDEKHYDDFYNNDIWIVPHVKSPLPNRNYMSQIYNTGHANADFIAIKNCLNSQHILKWLISVTQDTTKPGEFYEQTWLSSLPFLFDRVGIIRHGGYNVGYWDINQNFEKTNKGYRIWGHPLVMFQYSGYVKGEPEKMSKHSQELAANQTIIDFYKEYDRRITE